MKLMTGELCTASTNHINKNMSSMTGEVRTASTNHTVGKHNPTAVHDTGAAATVRMNSTPLDDDNNNHNISTNASYTDETNNNNA